MSTGRSGEMPLPRPLSHIRVLDFGQYFAGPLVGMMLADLGAEVIRIDPPGGPRLHSPATDMLSRGKSSLTLDLKSSDGLATALELVRRADITIENFRPGVMKRLGLGPDELRAANPAIISLSLPGFASTDPGLAPVAAWEAVIAARTGQFSDMGLNRRLMGINPSFTPLPLASAYGATFGAMATLFALGARDRNGGDHIEVPLASALLEGLVYNCEQIEDYPKRYSSAREIELDRRETEGLPCDLPFSELERYLDPFYRTYECADGRGFFVGAAGVSGHPQRALRALGLEELARSLPDFDAYLDQKDWPAEWSMRNSPVGERDRERLAGVMKAAFLGRPAREWEEIFGAAKVPGTLQRSTREWLSDPHALASGLVLRVSDPRRGDMRQMGNVAWLADDSAAEKKRPGHALDDASSRLPAILAEVPRTLRGGAESSGWLEGLRVVDLTNVVAGPTIGSTVARFGADVVSVQPVEPSLDPWGAVTLGVHAHRGKRSALLNLKTLAGREALEKLIAGADVVTMNCTDSQREELGLSIERLRALNPTVILVQVDAFGGPRRGPKSDHLGYDDLAQAATGVMVRFGGGLATPEEHAHMGTIDVIAGLSACVALGAALERRRRTGQGGVARTSLAAAGNLIQAPFMFDYPGRAPFSEPAGRETRGQGPFYHCYQARDDWMFFAAPEERRVALRAVPDLADLAEEAEENLSAALAARFATRDVAYWEKSLAGTSSAIIRIGSLRATRAAALVAESEGEIDLAQATFRVVRHDRHPMGRWIDLVAPNSVRPERGRVFIPGDAPKYGAQTREVLRGIGYAEERVKAMLAKGEAGDSWSENYLPE
ncbi:CoA transferase [Amycolatopsis sp. NPDC059090]|uniref:CoA transferase n=1 Tax=unclassified Amycolatopsis TaxID=2618356 RepID=UPI00367067E9